MSKGFSLIELMVVIAIVGVLSAIAVPFYKGYIERAKMARVYNEIKMRTASWSEVTSTGDWGETFNDMDKRYPSIPSDMPYLETIYFNPFVISYAFNPGYFNREATTYVVYRPVIDGVVVDENSNTINDVYNGKIITWTCEVSGVTGSYYGGYSIEEFRNEFFPSCDLI